MLRFVIRLYPVHLPTLYGSGAFMVVRWDDVKLLYLTGLQLSDLGLQSPFHNKRFTIESLARCPDRTESDSPLNRFGAFR